MPVADYENPPEPEEPAGPSQHPVRGPGSGLDPLPPQQPESLVDQMTVAAQRGIDIFRTAVSYRMLRLAPDTTFWNAIEQNDEMAAYAVGDVMNYAAQVFGDENLAANVDAELIANQVARAATRSE